MEFRDQRGDISFEEAERRHAELKHRYEAGQIDDERFDAERQRLVVRDDEGRSWAMSRQSGRWLYHDGANAWVEATPPTDSSASPQPSSGGRGFMLEKSPSQDSPERPAEEDRRRAKEQADEMRSCPGCGDPVTSKASFCTSCGEYLIPEVVEEAPPVSPTPPGEGQSGDPSEGDAGRRRKAPLLVVLGVAGLVMVLPAVAGLVVYLLWPAQAPAALETPTLEGRTLAAARQQVGGDLELVSTEEDSDEPRGTIIGQQPAPGTEVRRGQEVSVVVSSGVETAAVPDVVGRTREEAEAALRSAGFEVRAEGREVAEEDAGEVVEQSPSSSGEAKQGARVEIMVGERPPPPEEPSPPESASGPAPGYKVIEDPTGDLTVEVPSGWGVQTGVDSTGEVGDPASWSTVVGYPITSAITTAESLAAFYTFGQPKVGANIVASRELAEAYTDDELLYAGPFAFPAKCNAGPYEDFDRTPYSGKIQTWYCGVNTVYVVVASPEDRECVVLLDLTLPNEGASETDREAAQRILDTFEADCGDVATSEEDETIELATAGGTAPPG